jgi:hypothetical protein
MAFQFRMFSLTRFSKMSTNNPTSLSGGNSKLEPPDPISNSEVKQFSADGSVGSPHVRVGHRQALIPNTRSAMVGYFFCLN